MICIWVHITCDVEVGGYSHVNVRLLGTAFLNERNCRLHARTPTSNGEMDNFKNMCCLHDKRKYKYIFELPENSKIICFRLITLQNFFSLNYFRILILHAQVFFLFPSSYDTFEFFLINFKLFKASINN